MPGEPQPATLELPVGREEIEQLRFREAGTFHSIAMGSYANLCAGFGEEDTRYTQGRDSSPPASSPNLLDTLSFVYIPFGTAESRITKSTLGHHRSSLPSV
jgi:hypothetical protein